MYVYIHIYIYTLVYKCTYISIWADLDLNV